MLWYPLRDGWAGMYQLVVFFFGGMTKRTNEPALCADQIILQQDAEKFFKFRDCCHQLVFGAPGQEQQFAIFQRINIVY